MREPCSLHYFKVSPLLPYCQRRIGTPGGQPVLDSLGNNLNVDCFCECVIE